jgi:excisionase family DNA binding protein
MKLLTAVEVAAQLAVPPSWVYRAARSGEIPCVRLGHYVRFAPADVAAWVDALRPQ